MRLTSSLLIALTALSLSACDQRPGQAGLYTQDDRCIRLRQMRYEPLGQSVSECGMIVPDLSNDPDLQRFAAVNGQPFLKTEVERDSRAHWFYCHLTGDHPGFYPTATSPFQCESLHFSTPLDAPHERTRPDLLPAG